MNKKFLFLLAFILLLSSIVYAVTLTAEATRSVDVPAAAIAKICQVDESTNDCTDRLGEILFGNAVVESMSGDRVGMFLVQFGSDVYRSNTESTVHEYGVTTTDGKYEETIDTSSVRGDIENIEDLGVVGIRGTLSKVLPDGSEIITTGDTVTLEEEGKVSSSYNEPVGEFIVTYDGLRFENNLVAGGTYKTLELVFYQSGDGKDVYRMTAIQDTTSFEWEPSSEVSA